MVHHVKKYDGDGKYYATQKLKTALPDGEYGEQISFVSGVEVVNDVEKSCSDDAGDEGIEGGIRDELWVGCDVSAQSSYDVDGREKCDDHHQAIAPHGQRSERYSKKYTVHWSCQRIAFRLWIPYWTGTALYSVIGYFYASAFILLFSSRTKTLGLSFLASSDVQ